MKPLTEAERAAIIAFLRWRGHSQTAAEAKARAYEAYRVGNQTGNERRRGDG